MWTFFSKSVFKSALAALTASFCQVASAAEIAPYFYTWGGAKYNSLSQAKQVAGLSSATLAFAITRGSCSLDEDLYNMMPDIRNYISSGGQLIISFGGADGTYVEIACTDDDQLFNLIDRLIQDTGSQRLDFDVEGHQLSNTTSHSRRARVLARLQTKYPNMYISFTLPGWLNGMSSESINVLKTTIDAGVRINIVNIMAMSWGAENIRTMVSPATLGQATIDTMRATANQIQGLYPSRTTAQIYAMLGITPMIGTNDDGTTFTLADANTVANFAIQNGVGLLAYWAFQRDQAQSYAGQTNLNAYSGVVQSDFDFYRIFSRAATGSVAPPPVVTPPPGAETSNASDWVMNRPYAAGSIVRYSDGKYYIAKYANPGYNPTISTYYWKPYTMPANGGNASPACSAANWVQGQQYAVGSIVKYSNGSLYRAKFANPGYNPTISTYYWTPFVCN